MLWQIEEDEIATHEDDADRLLRLHAATYSSVNLLLSSGCIHTQDESDKVNGE